MVKKRGLGKSLDALLAYTRTEAGVVKEELDTPASKANTEEQLTTLPVKVLQRGKYQPRREMDPEALEELANSIRQQGIIQPIVVRPVAGNVKGAYEIVAGERRWHAAQLAGLSEVPVIIRHIPDSAAIAIALIENIQRENLNPIEEATAFNRLIQEFEMTHQEIADAVGKSRATVTNLLRLLSLPYDVKVLVESGKLEMGHARAILTLPETLQRDVAQQIAERGLSVREAEQLVKRLQTAGDGKEQPESRPDPDVLNWQNQLMQQLKMKVAIQCNAKGKGKVVIHYRNLRELDRLLSQFAETV